MKMTDTSDLTLEMLLIVIVNYRTADLVVDCLDSLEGEVAALPSARVIIVDNDSQDNSFETIGAKIKESGWGEWAQVVAAPDNGGYASGNNFAIRDALVNDNAPDYFWLLNPDTRVRPGAATALLTFASSHPEAGIFGSALSDENGPWPFAFRFPSLLSEIESGLRLGLISKILNRWKVMRELTEEPAKVDWVPGASMLVRRAVFESVGLMDERFFLYFEETDFCLRAHRAGWTCWYVPDSKVHHLRGQSTGVTKIGSQKPLPTYWFESRRRYFVKNKGLFYSIVIDFFWISSLALWRFRRFIQGKPDTDPPGLLGDAIRQSTLLKGRDGNSILDEEFHHEINNSDAADRDLNTRVVKPR